MTTTVRPIITLTTDFGLIDDYVAVMKGTILRICPNANIIDTTHFIARHNVKEASYIVSQFSRCFPNESIHVVVVDPGVGTERKRLAIRTRCGYLIGPDNGVLMPSARSQGILGMVRITRNEFMASSISWTRRVTRPKGSTIRRRFCSSMAATIRSSPRSRRKLSLPRSATRPRYVTTTTAITCCCAIARQGRDVRTSRNGLTGPILAWRNVAGTDA